MNFATAIDGVRPSKVAEQLKQALRARLKRPSYQTMASTAKRNWRLLLAAFLGNLFSAVFESSTLGIIFLALRVLQGESLAGENAPWLAAVTEPLGQGQLFVGLVAITVLLQFLRSGLAYAGSVASGYLQARIRAQLIEQVFRQIVSFSFAFASRYKIGDLTSYINQSRQAVQTQLRLWNELLVATLVALAYAAVLIAISPPLSALALLLGFAVVGVQRLLLPRIRNNFRSVTKTTVAINKQIVENIQALRLVHVFGRQRDAARQVRGLLQQLVPLLQRQVRLSQASAPINQWLTVTSVGLLLIAGYFLLRDRAELLIPSLFTFIAALNRLSGQFASFATISNGLTENAALMERVDEILTETDKEFVHFGGKQFERLQRGIRFERVTLTYVEGQEPAVSDISFEMSKGSVTALVGSSGAGKSSIVDLLVGLYAPTSGQIWVDGISLQHYDPESWRAALGAVSQDTFAFNQSILENIRYGHPQASRDEVIEAARAAQADRFVRDLPQGYETIVGERGYRLSGGQRQRLALARAILKQPEILILDEATSALDSYSEQLVQEALAVFQQDLTALIVAHRLSTIAHADRILVLESGLLVESGTHTELIDKGGFYTDYWQLQAVDSWNA